MLAKNKKHFQVEAGQMALPIGMKNKIEKA